MGYLEKRDRWFRFMNNELKPKTIREKAFAYFRTMFGENFQADVLGWAVWNKLEPNKKFYLGSSGSVRVGRCKTASIPVLEAVKAEIEQHFQTKYGAEK